MIVWRVKIHCRFLPFASLSSFALCSKIQFKICYRKELEQSSAWTRFASNLILCGINGSNLSFNILALCIFFSRRQKWTRVCRDFILFSWWFHSLFVKSSSHSYIRHKLRWVFPGETLVPFQCQFLEAFERSLTFNNWRSKSSDFVETLW